ncbi:carbohydrate kinase [Enterococcus villorum]|uniref:Carbohydrate kinase n=1 Tax=Enterococcus villorum TaxID=112904 RepID=A0A1V8YMJ5_9ENTE|nr:sugar kinase [Enterococcus villorum]OQO71123.1 carbohydrate kinase [Enterococcus villorum]OQO73840.1 carbohydrate kinase [Enterococcus villorum]
MKFGAFGEVMLRLTPPEHLMLEQTHTLRMAYTGTGVNLVGNLAHFDMESYLLTALPDNRLGSAALANLKSIGVQTKYVIQKEQHIGTYFAEMGYGVRPTEVTYQNRKHSSFGLSKEEDYAIQEFIDTVDLVHICGISLSLSDQCAQTAIALAKRAHTCGKKVCFDFNFRPTLNQEKDKKSKLKKRYQEILPYCTILFGSIRDLIELLEWSSVDSALDEPIRYIQSFLAHYGIEWFAGTKRITQDGKKQLKGYLITLNETVETAFYDLFILDRIGAGDAFAAGILLGYGEKWSLEKTVEFALGNARLAHAIQGDVPLTTRKQVLQLLDAPDIDLIR